MRLTALFGALLLVARASAQWPAEESGDYDVECEYVDEWVELLNTLAPHTAAAAGPSSPSRTPARSPLANPAATAAVPSRYTGRVQLNSVPLQADVTAAVPSHYTGRVQLNTMPPQADVVAPPARRVPVAAQSTIQRYVNSEQLDTLSSGAIAAPARQPAVAPLPSRAGKRYGSYIHLDALPTAARPTSPPVFVGRVAPLAPTTALKLNGQFVNYEQLDTMPPEEEVMRVRLLAERRRYDEAMRAKFDNFERIANLMPELAVPAAVAVSVNTPQEYARINTTLPPQPLATDAPQTTTRTPPVAITSPTRSSGVLYEHSGIDVAPENYERSTSTAVYAPTAPTTTPSPERYAAAPVDDNFHVSTPAPATTQSTNAYDTPTMSPNVQTEPLDEDEFDQHKTASKLAPISWLLEPTANVDDMFALLPEYAVAASMPQYAASTLPTTTTAKPASQYTAAGEQKEEVSSAYAKQPSTSTVASMATVRVRDRFILPTVKLANDNLESYSHREKVHDEFSLLNADLKTMPAEFVPSDASVVDDFGQSDEPRSDDVAARIRVKRLTTASTGSKWFLVKRRQCKKRARATKSQGARPMTAPAAAATPETLIAPPEAITAPPQTITAPPPMATLVGSPVSAEQAAREAISRCAGRAEGELVALGECKKSYFRCGRSNTLMWCARRDEVFAAAARGCTLKTLAAECRAAIVATDVRTRPISARLPPRAETLSLKTTTSAPTTATAAPTTATSTAARGALTCTKQADGFYRHHEDCSRVFQCFGGEMFEYPPCPQELVYNEERGLCDYRKNVAGCEVSTPPFTLPSIGSLSAAFDH